MTDDSQAFLSPDDDLTRRLEALHQQVVATTPCEDSNGLGDGQPDTELASVGELFQLMERARRQGEDDTAAVQAHDTTFPAGQSQQPLPSTAELTLLAEGRCLGRFTLRRRLGEGGYGFVFLALDGDLDRQVAVKIPRPEVLITDEMRVRFLREGKAAALLSHPYIVPVFETGHAGRICYIVSQYVDGITLADWLARSSAVLDPHTAAKIAAALADAVQHAHSKGVIHRDLKPANVLLEGYDSHASGSAADLDRAVRITDFGLAKVDHEPHALTGTGAVIGTPCYMSPEQANGAATDATTDVYALGVMLYELLTGTPPHKGNSLLQTLRDVQDREPVAPRRHNSSVPRDLEAVCLKCLEKQPTRRYASANELQRDLERYLSGQPVLARPVTRLEHAWRWCRRNPGLAATLGALVLSITIGGALVGYQMRQTVLANQELKSKNKELVISNDHLKRARNEERATVEFLATSFARPDPKLDGRQVTLASLLDRNMRILQANQEMAGTTKASLAFSLGRAYEGLGLHEEAIDAFQFSSALWANEVDESSEFRLSVQGQLGFSFVETGRYAEAIELLEKAVAIATDHLGRDHAKTTGLLNHLALACQGIGDSDRAIDILRALYDTAAKPPQELTEEALQTTANLGFVLAETDRYEEAIPLQEAALERSRTLFGDDDPRTLKQMSNLAASYASAGKPGPAAPLIEEVLAVRRVVLGDDHMETLVAENNLAGALMTSGNVEKAVHVLANLVPRAKRIMGEHHPHTLGMTMNLGGGYLWLNRPQEAAGVFEPVWLQMREVLGASHPSTLKAYELLGQARLESQELSEAETIFRELIESERARPALRPTSLAKLLWLLGRSLVEHAELDEAESVLREAVKLYSKHAPQRWQAGDAKSLLGATLVQLGHRQEGQALLRAGHRELQAAADKIPVARRDTVLQAAAARVARWNVAE